MSVAAPCFWWRKAGPAALALAPVGAVYGAMTAYRMTKAGARIGVPVLCIGNFVVGGAGKTPTAIAVATRLAARGQSPAFVSRGYGRREARGTRGTVTRVEPSRHKARDVGDEPLLLARAAPCFVSDDRVAAAMAAVAAGATVVVMDDGFQNPGLGKDASVVAVDGAAGVGNGFCLPAGPLRAPLSRQWPSTTLLAVIGAGPAGETLAAEAIDHGINFMDNSWDYNLGRRRNEVQSRHDGEGHRAAARGFSGCRPARDLAVPRRRAARTPPRRSRQGAP